MLFNTLVLLLAAGVSAHPGENHAVSHEAQAARNNFVQHVKRNAGTCNSLARREIIAEKHRNKIAQLRREVAEKKKAKRDYATIDHESDRTDITADMSLSDLFTDDDATCLLQPEVTNGPYFVTGEYVRNDITEDQEGVPLYTSYEIFDTNTCETIPNLYWEIWHCNAMGIYSGVEASGNGDGTDYYNSTWLRGIAEADDNGAVTMQTIFPGHYTGRATHIHVMAHQNVTVFDNGTIGSGAEDTGNILHIGQLFFDQDLISEVEATSPYSDNTQELTENTDDSILSSENTADAPDPFFKYALLGDDISDGVYAWVAIGVDATASYTANPAAYYDAEGGHAIGDSSSGGMGGGSGGMPSGSGMPDGSGMASGSGAPTDASGNSTAAATGVETSSSASTTSTSSDSSSDSSSSSAAEDSSVADSTSTATSVDASSGAGTRKIPGIFSLISLTIGSFVAFYL